MPPSLTIVADECVHRGIIAALRDAGYSVLAIAERGAGSTDGDVLALAVEIGEILITSDRDYGELVFRFRSPPPACILYMRVRTAPWREATARLLAILAGGSTDGQFIVIDGDDDRRRPFPHKV